jgi:hypothetical protein
MPSLSSTIFGGGLDISDISDFLFSVSSTYNSCSPDFDSQDTIIDDEDSVQTFLSGQSKEFQELYTSLRRRVKQRSFLTLEEWSEYLFMGLECGHLKNEL